MFLKMIGISLIMCTTFLGGGMAADKIKVQYEQLKYLQKLICRLRSEIRYAKSYLGEAFYQIGMAEKSPYREWLLGMSEQMEEKKGGRFLEIWEEQTKKNLHNSGLSKETLVRLMDFGGQLGGTDVEMQVKALELYQEEIELSMEEIREEMRTKMRLCHCLGIMSGIFVIILLL